MSIGHQLVPADAVLAHLQTLLADCRFASAERNAAFLRYVVERTLEGRTAEIKETVIATDVYGRGSDYDPKTGAIVRVEASRLRQKLRAYYESDGRHTPVRIHLPSGSYVPQFELIAPDVVQPDPEPPPASPPYRRPLAWIAIASAVLVLLSVHQLARGSRADAAHQPEAVVAWQEAKDLLDEDPHTAQTDRGAPPSLVRAVERLEFAVARDPKFAAAWAKLAEAYDYIYPYVGRDPQDDARRAEEAARRAVALDPGFEAGHHMLGLVQLMMKWDFAAAEQSYRKALDLNPRNMWAALEYADLLRETGRAGDAAQLIRRSRALLPALPQLAGKEAEIQLDLGHPAAAIAAADSAIHLNRSFLRAYVTLGMAEEVTGDHTAALAHYEYVLTVDPTDRRALPAYGHALARAGRLEQARNVAATLERMNATVRNCAFQIAMVYAGLGEHDRALNWLEQAWRTRQVHFPFAAVEPRFRPLRDHPRFRDLLARVRLAPL